MRISDWSSDVCSSDLGDASNRPMAEKIDELTLPHWRAALHFADDRKLLPRAYLWGLADTVRTGVEGRGIGMHFVWGQVHYGHPPWFRWPSDRTSVVEGKSVAVRLDLGGGRNSQT